ncbi:MAG TPA: helix-turn-helix domain-containing protein [Pseudonocardia sp.]|nr:helix-turn-helix domain-containing protein [Pseudonocardia sp.]
MVSKSEVVMVTRLTRAERTERVRADLLVAARRTFLSRGFHQASLEEIALAAGWSKGAVFSNFAGKDELFLAVLDDQNRRRRREQIAEMQVAPTLAEALLAAGREMAGAHERDPQWTPLLVEFWTHASRDDALRARVSAAHEDLLDGYAAVVAELAARDGLEFTAPVKAVCRSAAALARGLALERLLDPGAVPEPDFGELFCAHILSRTRRVEP